MVLVKAFLKNVNLTDKSIFFDVFNWVVEINVLPIWFTRVEGYDRVPTQPWKLHII